MSWDIFVQDFPKTAQSVSEIPEDFAPASLGSRHELIQKIKHALPAIDFSNPTWGILDDPNTGYSIELNMGEDETMDGFALHVRGGDAAVESISVILEATGLRALDSESGEFFDCNEAYRSLEGFTAYVAQVLNR